MTLKDPGREILALFPEENQGKGIVLTCLVTILNISPVRALSQQSKVLITEITRQKNIKNKINKINYSTGVKNRVLCHFLDETERGRPPQIR